MQDRRELLEMSISRLLSRMDRPVKARAIAVLLGDEIQTIVHKRDINPILYRMLRDKKLTIDSEFRWSINMSSVAPSSLPSVRPPSNIKRSVLESVGGGEADTSEREWSLPKPEIRVPSRFGSVPLGDYGKFRLVEEICPYPRHCKWCLEEIRGKTAALVVYGVKNGRPRFCSPEHFRNWESVFWQRVALSHLQFSRGKLKRELRFLRFQRKVSTSV